MKLHMKLALVVGALALGLVPGMALAEVTYTPEGPNYQPEHPVGAPPPHAKAYGFHCKGQSKKHVKGQQGTDFSRCVKAMARADHNPNISAKKACHALSKKHVKGQQGTPFSRCVKGVNELRQEKAATVSASSVA